MDHQQDEGVFKGNQSTDKLIDLNAKRRNSSRKVKPYSEKAAGSDQKTDAETSKSSQRKKQIEEKTNPQRPVPTDIANGLV